jgi:hypothetical protein
VEEVNLRWVQTSWSSWDCIIDWGNSTEPGFSWDFVGFDFLFKIENWGIAEDKGNFIL